ncbi:discoidin domain-containing protein [Micromonospora sp. M12]
MALVATLTPTGTTTPAQAAPTLLSQGRTATASSTENAGTSAAAAVDGNTGTRWSSAFSDPQWLQVDLGARATITQVNLLWEAAHGRAFQLQTSDNGSTWTTIYSTTTSTGGPRTSPSPAPAATSACTAPPGHRLRLLALGVPGLRRDRRRHRRAAGRHDRPVQPNLGSNTFVFDPSTPTSTIQSRLNTLFTQQETNQFGPQRYAVLFKPGTYTADVNLGFFTQVAGLGLSPDDVNLNGHVRTEAFWMGGNATQNFWRAAENLSVTLPAGQTVERWAVSQAAPYRRMHLRGRRTRSSSGTVATAGPAVVCWPTPASTAWSSPARSSSGTPATASSVTAGPVRCGTWSSRASTAPRHRASPTPRTPSSRRPRRSGRSRSCT